MVRFTSMPSFWREFLPKSWEFVFRRYSWSWFRSDLLAGVTVGVVALPLAMAFAIAAGVDPERGLYTAIVAGFLISLLGGSRLQIGGPTGAFVVIIASIMQRHGYGGLVFVTLLAGVILLIAAFSRMGSLMKYVPYPLVTGFTTGIAVIIFSSQVKDFFGLRMQEVPAEFVTKWIAIISQFSTFDPLVTAVSCGTLALIIVIRRWCPVLPWGISAVFVATCVTWGFDLPVATIASRFGEIPRALPAWGFPDFSLALENWQPMVADAVTVAFLAGIESLLSAVVADGMAGTRHRSNCELFAQGVANIASVSFGGIPATGAIARTATNVKTGAKTPLAGMIHALTLLVIVLLLAPVVSQISLAALSAVLMMVAWNMSELDHFRHLFRAPKGDVAVLLTAFLLTVFVDLTVAVEVGMILAAFLFMKRMGDLSSVVPWSALRKEEMREEAEDCDAIANKHIPAGVEVYEVAGPFFFGVADSLKNVLANLEFAPKVCILRMRKVPVIDASGMHALREFYFKCGRAGTILLLSGVGESLKKSLREFGVLEKIGETRIFAKIDLALNYAETLHSSKKET